MTHPIGDAIASLAVYVRALEERLALLEAKDKTSDYIAAIQAGWKPVGAEVCPCCRVNLQLVAIGKYECPNCHGRC